LTDTWVSYDGLSYYLPMVDGGGGSSFTINTVQIFSNTGETTYTGASSDAIPEPATLALVGLGGIALLARRRRRSIR